MSSASRISALVVTSLLLSAPLHAAFTSHSLVLRQDAVPLLDAAPLGSTAYSGFVDTYVDSANPGTSYFSDAYVHFGSEAGPSSSFGPVTGPTTRGYLRFGGFTPYLPAGAVITSATLTLTSAGPFLLGSDASNLSYRTAAFDGYTFGTAGTGGSNRVQLTSIGSWERQWANGNVQVVDLTNLVRQWQSGAIANNGLQFTGSEGNGWSGMGQQFYSSEYATDPAKRPTVQIQYVVPEQLPPSTAPANRRVEVLSGAAAISDTWISSTSATTPKGAVGTGYIQEWTNGDHVLMKINDAAFAGLAKTGDPFVDGTTKLVGASLQLGINPDFRTPSLSLWRVNADWSDTAATWNTTDGSTAWSPAWINSQMSGGPATLVTSTAYSSLIGSPSISFDVTALLQSYIDGSLPNFGLVLGGSGPAWLIGVQEAIYLTEYGTDWLRPTLVIETLQMLPEPASGALLLLAGAVLAATRRRA